MSCWIFTIQHDLHTKNGILKGEISNIKDNNNLDNKKNLSDKFLTIFNDYKGLKDPKNTALYVLGDFLTNYLELKDANTIGADKYFHARANYESAQQGLVGSLVAKLISDLREWNDTYRNIAEKGYSKEESEKDIIEDQTANELGRMLGRENPTTNAFEILKFLIPKGFPERYKRR